jgi:hypothetical protein
VKKNAKVTASRPVSFIETAAVKETFVGCVLFDVGGVSLLASIGMMFMLHRFIVRWSAWPARSAFIALVARRHGGHSACHENSAFRIRGKIKSLSRRSDAFVQDYQCP